MRILIGLIFSLKIYTLQAQHAYNDAVRIKNFIQFIPQSAPARDSIELIDTLFNMGKMVSELYSPELKDSILSILSKYYVADSLNSVLDSNSVSYNPYLTHLAPYLFTYSKTTWPKLNRVDNRKYINTRGGYRFDMEESGFDFSRLNVTNAEYSKMIYVSWFNFLIQTTTPQIIPAYLNLIQSLSIKSDHEKYFRNWIPHIKKYLDQHKIPSAWSTDMPNIKNAIKLDLVNLKTNLNSSSLLPPDYIRPEEVDHLFNLLQKDIHDLRKSYGKNELTQVILNGLIQGSEPFKLQRMLSLGVLILGLTDPVSGKLLQNINDLKETEVYKMYLGLVYARLNKLMVNNSGM